MRKLLFILALIAVETRAQEQATLGVNAVFREPEQRCRIEALRPLHLTFRGKNEAVVTPASSDAGAVIFIGRVKEAMLVPSRLLLLARSDRLPRRVPIRWEPEIERLIKPDGIEVRIGGRFRLPPSAPPGLYRAVIELQAYCE